MEFFQEFRAPSSSCLLFYLLVVCKVFSFFLVKAFLSLSRMLHNIYSTSKLAGTSPTTSDHHPVVLE